MVTPNFLLINIGAKGKIVPAIHLSEGLKMKYLIRDINSRTFLERISGKIRFHLSEMCHIAQLRMLNVCSKKICSRIGKYGF